MNRVLWSDEKLVADKDYLDDRCSKLTVIPEDYRGTHREIRAFRETLNRRFKHSSILNMTFRHSFELYGYVFHWIANLSHLSIQLGEPLFDKILN